MKNKLKKILVLIPLFFTLTGCDWMTNYTYTTEGFEGVTCGFSSWYINLIQSWNDAYAIMYNLIGDMIDNAGDVGYTYVEAFGSSVASIVNVVSVLAAVAIVVRFAINVAQENMFEQNSEMAADLMTRIKKVIVAIIVTFSIPYLCITAYIGSGYIGGVAAGKVMANQVDNQARQIYEEMNKVGVTYATYCRTAQPAAILAPDKNTSGSIFYLDADNSKTLTGKDYDYWCGDGTHQNVYMSLFAEGRSYSNIAPFKPTFFTLVEGLTSLASIVIVVVVAVFMSYSIAKLAVQMLFLIATGWWYTSSYIADKPREESSLGKFFKKLIEICLTVFFLIFELAIFVVVILGNPGSSIVLSMAFVMIMFSTPTAISDLIQQTGTAQHALQIGGGIFKRFF